jgi:hypothetical protein
VRRLALAAILAALAFPAAASAKADPFYGVGSQTPLGSGDYKKMDKGGVGTLRSILGWSAANPTRNGDYVWSGFDAVVAGAARERIRVLPFVYGTPRWVARGLDSRQCGTCDAYAPRHRAALDAWEEFIAAAAERYGPGGNFWSENPQLPRVPIRAWQIWNEQNSETFYAPKPSVKAYAKLLDAASAAIRSHDGKADIVLGGMAELAGSRKTSTTVAAPSATSMGSPSTRTVRRRARSKARPSCSEQSRARRTTQTPGSG